MNFSQNRLQNKQNILHPATSIVAIEENGAHLMASAKGVYVTDVQGNQLLDGIAGLWCCNLGHGRDEIADTLANAARNLDYFHTFNGHSNLPQEALAERLIAMAPQGMSHVFFGCSGSDGNDSLIKIAWQYFITRGQPKKRKIISRWQAYHGTSISTASLTGLKGFHKDFHLPLDFAIHTDCPFYYQEAQADESEADYVSRLLANLEALIDKEGAENIAALIGEPIMGAGGVITPPSGYWPGVEKICRQHDILLIADEVVCGFGRTGKHFGSEHYDFTPDMMNTAKGITNGVFPMSAAFISEPIHDVMRQASSQLGGFSHGYTYSGHPVGAAVANKVLDIMAAENLVENAAECGAYLHQQLHRALADHPNVGEIRGQGLLAAIQLMADANSKQFYDPAKKMAAQVSAACYQKGLIIRPLPSVNSLALSPPLVLSYAEADLIVEKLLAGLNQVFQ